ncbi:MAG: hypothetical protein A3G23_04555 [Bacteroidetes bacterium RIFCSPLOWO2_12_FULL_37_12]|nr:MAG: hypothetical protein A3G23_04555 [Bacteroidetes bacterium RIFCSPLOWO2_12_FULL_37_12]
MRNSIRQSTLETLGLGTVLEIFKKGKLPVTASEMADKVFGKSPTRGALVISGANGIVGAGKTMQFGSRLLPFNIPIIALDLPGSPDGIGKHFSNLSKTFGKNEANAIMKNIIKLNYDGATVPDTLKTYNPRYLLEAIPEILNLKKKHYELFRNTFPGIQISSVTSGFPSSQLGVNIAHPAFPHEINKIWEIAEPTPSDFTQLLWSLGLIPLQVSDHWSFVLDVFFCGLMLAGLRYHNKSNMPFWKTDKYIRQLLGPNPFRAHDAIGAKGANFLTWSCLHHLDKNYGTLFTPTAELEERKESGQNWYPLDHFRPLVNWSLDKEENEIFQTMMMGALFQMTSIMIHEKRSHLSSMNSIGELCAQFTRGILSMARKAGYQNIMNTVQDYHKLHPESANTKWYPDIFNQISSSEWQQLYVNAEFENNAGVITISRESYNQDIDDELNRAIDWLKAKKVKRVILTGDFHLSTQMVGADTNDFFPALTNANEGERIASSWSATARRLYNEFEISVGFINGKRCMGGMLELMIHCHYLISLDDTVLAMPEVTLPVVPGMEGCHWSLRKTKPELRQNIISMLMEGGSVKAQNSVGWLIDFSGSMEIALKKTWEIIGNGKEVLPFREVFSKPIENITFNGLKSDSSSNQNIMESRKAIADCIINSCNADLNDALTIQAKHSAGFMLSKLCRKGRVGSEYDKINVN